MKRLVMKSPFSWSKLSVFLSGMILGAVVARHVRQPEGVIQFAME
jgi:hypothetical protein